ncbi:sensor histidine kinase [Bariatricus sp. SGI.154]|uniref:sensor histidine kinase n=1 Tax=Bariatricus sp. SGI.154 TaxID=3420549 RepID=UPI003D0687D6
MVEITWGTLVVMIIVALICGILMVVAYGKCYRMQRDIDTFSDHLEKCLDAMIAGRDITEYEQLEDSLWGKIYEKLWKVNQIWKRQSQNNIEEKRQMKELISDISHQTKTPIANMKVYLDILEHESAGALIGTDIQKDYEENINENAGEGWNDFLQKMKGQTEKLDFLIQSMVKMSRLETGVIEIRQRSCSIFGTLGHAVAGIVPKAEQKGIGLYVDCKEDITVYHDQKWTEEAISNILDNAVKYTPGGGTICISAVVQEFFTKISIKDSGKGIARERQAEIFQRFYREPEVHDQEGIGVGLYLARKIITMQNGYIEVNSEVGKGAEFSIYLPNEIR